MWTPTCNIEWQQFYPFMDVLFEWVTQVEGDKLWCCGRHLQTWGGGGDNCSCDSVCILFHLLVSLMHQVHIKVFCGSAAAWVLLSPASRKLPSPCTAAFRQVLIPVRWGHRTCVNNAGTLPEDKEKQNTSTHNGKCLCDNNVLSFRFKWNNELQVYSLLYHFTVLLCHFAGKYNSYCDNHLG